MFKRITFFALLVLTSFAVPCKANDPKNVYGVILAGMNGGGGGSFKKCAPQLFLHENLKNFQGARPTMNKYKDLGQQICIDIFNEKFENKHFNMQYGQNRSQQGASFIFAGTSQGTATLTNWLGQKPREEQEQLTSALFLESVLGSGNSGILHTVDNMILPGASYLPFSRAWIPFAAKAIFWHYKPWGMQAIKSASKLSPNIPVIIMHHVLDKQTCIDDARRVYCELRKAGNNNVYLFEITGLNRRRNYFNDTVRHIDVLDFAENKDDIQDAIQAIFEKHDIHVVGNKLEREVNLSPYQPTVKEVEQRIAANSGRKNFIRNIIDSAAGIALAAGISYLAKNYVTQACFKTVA